MTRPPHHSPQHLPPPSVEVSTVASLTCIIPVLSPYKKSLCLVGMISWSPRDLQVPECGIIFYVFGENGACGKRESELLIGFMAITPRAALCPR